jgi:drug/metabolite transporter (DMT)-like permease
MSKVEGKKKWILLILLQLVIMIYTLSGVAAKFAAGYEVLSMGFILCYGVEICILGLYAIFWQQIIKRVDLSVAYANRSIAILWSMIWATLIFGEHISVQNIIGVLLVIAGTMIVNKEG